MASLPCKLVGQIAFKAGGDIFHSLLTSNPGHFTKAAPSKIQSCTLLNGTYATEGSIIEWNYTHEGKTETAKQVITNLDEEKKQVSYKFIEGDLVQLYKNLIVTFHVETSGGVDFITWTIDYELVNADVPHPITLLKLAIELTVDIETHIFG
ncbi:kirola-like [Andrographis paniculata]|uniref:kirola-like n=1 Tax=Andrographis paniculata TaxID=175694 RepID=UPI0021E7EAD2|nr:kirola-like [Andrographis paniculata]